MKLLKIILAIVVVFIVAVFVLYGTISPCGILKKEIATKDKQGVYILFGGFIERGVDTLSPFQCVTELYKTRTEGVDKTINDFLSR